MTTPTDTFNALRPRLFGIAYRMLGIRADAEDIVQEAWLRWHATGHEEARIPEAWLTTVVTRLAIDRLRSARTEREHYFGPWLPEPLLDDESTPSPEQALEEAGDISTAFLLMLERLGPEERAVFLLHQVFDFDYPEVAAMVGKTEAACRKIMQRARERVREGRPRFSVNRELHIELLGRFIQASRSGDRAAVRSLLTEDATYTGDGGGKAKTTVNVIYGAERIGRLIAGLQRKHGHTIQHEIVRVNGGYGLLTSRLGQPDSITTIDIEGGMIAALYVVRNPDKLSTVR